MAFGRCFSFTSTGAVAVKGGTSLVHGCNILAGADAATIKVVGATSGKIYGAAGAAAGGSSGCVFCAPIVVDEADASLTVTISGTTPSATVVVE